MRKTQVHNIVLCVFPVPISEEKTVKATNRIIFLVLAGYIPDFGSRMGNRSLIAKNMSGTYLRSAFAVGS